MAKINKQEIFSQCDRVRSDSDSINWVTFVYEDNAVVKYQEGEDYDEFYESMKSNNDRVYAYLRVQTGDAMSKRSKFAFITYYGTGISPIAKAKCSTDKTAVKSACPDVAKDFLFDGHMMPISELTDELRKAGGANYDAQA